ncbi:MAG: hypothetical protein M1824_005416 [Vezdaea acicularis]|nr:MAG: hypothetical protein M1824_005416 [Vezdaea acicularis]
MFASRFAFSKGRSGSISEHGNKKLTDIKASTAHNGVSPVLISRARSIAHEHDDLSKAVAENFDSRAAKRIGELSAVAKALRNWEDVNKSISELRALAQDPQSGDELRSLALEDLEASNAELASTTSHLISTLIPPHPFAHLPCLLEIRPGAGGGEASIFAGDLLQMYQAYCSRTGLRATLLKYEDDSGAGSSSGSNNDTAPPLQEAILEIETAGSYGLLRCEAGVHRVQRVPATESKGRTHTSSATVLVLPSLPTPTTPDTSPENTYDDPTSDYYIAPRDVRTETMRARGAGGQHVNTTDSAVRLTHLPTSTVVSIQDARSQHKNREKAWRLLRAKLAQAKREAREAELLKLRRSVIGHKMAGREFKVRTYNWGQQRVTDHRSGVSLNLLDEVVAGGQALETVMASVRAWMMEREVEGMIAEEEAAAAAVATGKKK